jgi:MinD-like ATPase involved in chromosome partitioning or flagellar assembly
VGTIALLSAKGSPGVTTTTVALTLAWAHANPGRTALGVDADAVGGDMAAGVLRGGAPVYSGMLPLATARGADPVRAVEGCAVHLRADGSARVIPGVPDSARATALAFAWGTLEEARAELDAAGTDVLVDAGRVDLSDPVPAWLTGSDRALLVVRPTLPAVGAARRLAEAWTATGAPTARTPLELVVVESPSPYRAQEVAEAVRCPLAGCVPFDAAGARVHAEGAAKPRGFARSGYVRAVVDLAGRLGPVLPGGGGTSRPEVVVTAGPSAPTPGQVGGER